LNFVFLTQTTGTFHFFLSTSLRSSNISQRIFHTSLSLEKRGCEVTILPDQSYHKVSLSGTVVSISKILASIVSSGNTSGMSLVTSIFHSSFIETTALFSQSFTNTLSHQSNLFTILCIAGLDDSGVDVSTISLTFCHTFI